MENEIAKLKDAIINDYLNRPAYNKGETFEKMNREFIDGVRIEEGRKYIKIIAGHSVWGFVVAVDNDKKFRKGDILMAAGYSTPARNKARGNIFENYSVAWTGPHYLK